MSPLIVTDSNRIGTGVVFDDNYRIVTAEALLRGITAGSFYHIEIETSFGSSFEAEILGVDPVSGVAVLEPKQGSGGALIMEPLRPARFNNRSDIDAGNLVLMVSSCFGMNNSAFWGMVSGKQQWLDCYLMHDYIQTTLPLQPGAVGAPVCNINGEVVGLMAAAFRQSPWREVSFAIPCARFMDVIPMLIEDGCVHRGYLGLCIGELNDTNRKELDIPDNLTGVVVAKVLEDSPAAQASIQAGDLILSIGSTEVSSVREVLWIIANLKPSEKVQISMIRNKKPHATEVILGDSCSNVFRK